MRIKSWSHQVVITGCLLMTTGCATTGKDVSTTILPNRNGDGARAEIEIEYESIKELPKKLVTRLGSALVSIAQPVHPYHKGTSGKVWFPFWRIIGKHHGDSVVGIIYDHGWFGGWRETPGDKLGKAAGLALLIWGADSLADDSSANESSRCMGEIEIVPCHESSTEDDNPDPDDWDRGTWRPVGGTDENGPFIPPVTDPAPPQENPPAIPPVVSPTILSRTGGRVGQ